MVKMFKQIAIDGYLFFLKPAINWSHIYATQVHYFTERKFI